VAPYVLRFWETEFPQLKPNKGGTGQRLYRKKDVEIALRIKALLYEQGFTIPGARQVLKGDVQPAGISEVTSEIASRPILLREADPAAAAFDPGADLRLRAQLADLRDEMQSLLGLLNQPAAGQSHATVPAPAAAAATPKSPRPRLVLEPKPAPLPMPKPAAPLGLHLAQGDLFPAE
jgi:DNA-binding transcriptional MerR regulator